jgi:hypothetical protein
MKFRVLIKKIWRIESSDLWLLEGEKIEGDTVHNCLGVVELGDRIAHIRIKSVAMTNGGKIDLRQVLLSIQKPDCDPSLLAGKVLVALEQT